MLTISIGETEMFNESTGEFVEVFGTKVQLEHSLASLSKWESKFKTSFLNHKDWTGEESKYYIECMILGEVSPEVLQMLTNDNYLEIQRYIDDPYVATTFGKDPQSGGPVREIITAEIIYYWMFGVGLPLECENWNLNKLMAVIKTINLKTNTKKMSRKDVLAQNNQINAQRRLQFGTSG